MVILEPKIPVLVEVQRLDQWGDVVTSLHPSEHLYLNLHALSAGKLGNYLSRGFRIPGLSVFWGGLRL